MKHSLLVVALLILPSTVPAHHSDAGIDTDRIIALEGTVTEYHWRNPHVYILVDVESDNGETVPWEVQMGPVSVISRRGWSSDSVAPGDKVAIRAHPDASGRPYGILQSLEKEGGSHLSTLPDVPELPPAATSIAGNWIADPERLVRYPGGFDGFFHAHLVLTEAGRQAQEDFDPLSADNPESTCIGRPTPAMLVSTGLYLMQIEPDEENDVVLIRSEWFNEERTIHMDGREHPPADQRFETGHSIGWWEGDTLVVDTANFTDHRSPYQVGVPSGPGKHVVERYRLIEGGTHLELSFTLEDPEFLAEPMTHTRDLVHSPHMELLDGSCDPEATGRFVKDQG